MSRCLRSPARCLLALMGAATPLAASAENYLVVLLDDVGVDKIGAYAEAPDPGRTPTIDALAARGVLFRNAWANPTCSPTRASALTGRRAELTGVGIGLPPGPGLDPDERTIADVLRERGYATAALGKWHLGRPREALESGFDTHRGTRANLGPGGYFHWRKLVDGVDRGMQRHYATSATADDAIAWIGEQAGPWFAWLAFHAPHVPLHAPPDGLHSQGDLAGANEPALYAAMLEALDRELARVLEAAGTDTTVIVLGDNGTYERAIEPPFDPAHGKQSLYEGGVNVPLIVAGPAVPARNRGKEAVALVQATDLFTTLAALAGSEEGAADSVSFAPQLADASAPGRSSVYTSRFSPNGGPPDPASYERAARDARFKLIRRSSGPPELYDLARAPHEQHDLLLAPLAPEAERSRTALARLIDRLEWSEGEPAGLDGPALWRATAMVVLVAIGAVAALRLARRSALQP
jgi:arylsulfatase A-like enzyme